MTGLLSAQRVVFGCVAEPTPRFYEQALRLVRSIRWFGGALANADVFVCVVDQVDAAWRREFEALGAQVRVVQPFNPLNRFSNKIRFLELPELADYETAVLLDCDMALVQDPAPYFAQPALQLKIADLATVPSEVLARLCAHFGLITPAPIYRTTCSEEPTIWYCNTGVMILPTAWIGRILPAWRDFILQLCAEPALLEPHYHHCNQAAMALAYIADPLPFAELPVAMNFPLNQTERRPAAALLREDPVILHYHDRVGADGLLLATPYPLAQARIQQLNDRLRASGRAQPIEVPVGACVIPISIQAYNQPRRARRARRPRSPLGALRALRGGRAYARTRNGISQASAKQLSSALASDQAAEGACRGVVCITGMHRSGTSLVAQILHSCGPYLGPYQQLAAPAADNLNGYWEHPDFHKLNDDILAHFGGGWDVAPSLPANWADLPELEPLRQRAQALIRQFDDQQFWGWKDPRSALTMPFWRKLIPGLKVVICVRNPLEVAQSLSRRGMSSLTFGLRLWQSYYERLLASVAPQDRIVTHYDSYFVDAAAETQRVLGWLNIPASAQIIQRACGVASEDLRHHRDTTVDLLEIELPSAVLQLYGQLCDQARVPDGAILLNAAPERVADTDDARMSTPAERLAGAIALLRAHEAALATLRSAFVTSQTELAILQPVLAAREAEVAFLQPTLTAREAEIAGYARELSMTRDVLAAREAEIIGYACELASLRDVLAAREAEIAGYARELGMSRALLAAREAEISDYACELASTRGRHAPEAGRMVLQAES